MAKANATAREGLGTLKVKNIRQYVSYECRTKIICAIYQCMNAVQYCWRLLLSLTLSLLFMIPTTICTFSWPAAKKFLPLMLMTGTKAVEATQ